MRHAIVSLTLALGSVSSAFGADPLSNLVPERPGAAACFQRVYDGGHLKQHPRQGTRVVLLSFQRAANDRGNIIGRISLQLRDRAEVALIGTWCDWRASGVNRGEHARRLVPSFPKDFGVQCQALPFWSVSGEDASLFPIDLDASGRSLTLYLRESVSLWTGAFTPEPPVLRLGGDDRVFRLERADAAVCAALERAISE